MKLKLIKIASLATLVLPLVASAAIISGTVSVSRFSKSPALILLVKNAVPDPVTVVEFCVNVIVPVL